MYKLLVIFGELNNTDNIYYYLIYSFTNNYKRQSIFFKLQNLQFEQYSLFTPEHFIPTIRGPKKYYVFIHTIMTLSQKKAVSKYFIRKCTALTSGQRYLTSKLCFFQYIPWKLTAFLLMYTSGQTLVQSCALLKSQMNFIPVSSLLPVSLSLSLLPFSSAPPHQGLKWPRLASNSLCDQLLMFLPPSPEKLKIQASPTHIGVCWCREQTQGFLPATQALHQLTWIPSPSPVLLKMQTLHSPSFKFPKNKKSSLDILRVHH